MRERENRREIVVNKNMKKGVREREEPYKVMKNMRRERERKREREREGPYSQKNMKKGERERGTV